MDNTLSGEPVVELPGPILLGGFFQFFMLGIIITQGMKYWADYRDDSWRKRAFVGVTIFVCILQTTLEGYKSWRTLVHQRKWSSSNIQWSDLFLNGLLSSMCEAFFIRRCWKMTNKSRWILYPLATLLATIIVANTYLAIAMAVAFRTLEAGLTFKSLDASRSILISTVVTFSYWIFGSFVVISLWKSKTGLVELDQVLMCIIQITLESAAMSTVCMILAVGLYHASPHLQDHLILFFILLTGKLHTIGMLRTLNSRAKLRLRMRSHDFGRTSLDDWQWDKARHPGSLAINPGFPSEPPRAFSNAATLRSSINSVGSSTSNAEPGDRRADSIAVEAETPFVNVPEVRYVMINAPPRITA